MTRLIRCLAVAGLAAALALLVVSASLASGTKKAHKSKTQHIHLVVKSDEQHGKKGPDGKWHDSFLPGNFKVAVGDKVIVTVRNYDDMPHSFTAPTLHLNKLVPGAKGKTPGKVTFSFTVKKAGKYLWWCVPGCDPWAMTHIGYMRGYVKAVA